MLYHVQEHIYSLIYMQYIFVIMALQFQWPFPIPPSESDEFLYVAGAQLIWHNLTILKLPKKFASKVHML